MNLLIFGSTGATGRQLVQQALQLGHSVTAFVRDSARLQIGHALLRSVVGDVMNASSVDAAVAGHDGVLCSLVSLPEGKADVAPPSARHAGLLGRDRQHRGIDRQVRRRAHRCRERATRVRGKSSSRATRVGFILRLFLRDVMQDKERQQAILRSSALDWTIVRVPKLNKRPATGRLKSGGDLGWSVVSSASGADVAAFMLVALADDATLRRAITVRD